MLNRFHFLNSNIKNKNGAHFSESDFSDLYDSTDSNTIP